MSDGFFSSFDYQDDSDASMFFYSPSTVKGVWGLGRKQEDKYAALKAVLKRATEQASEGKGKERHADGEAFNKQQICQIPRWQKSVDFVTGQAIKKCLEIERLSSVEAKVRELLGAINYIAAAVIVLEEREDKK